MKRINMVWVIILVLIFVCIVTAIIYSNHTMKVKWEEATNTDVRLVREAAEHSVRASNTTNPILALTEAVAAHRTVEMLVRRYGIPRASELTGIDIGEMLQTLARQRDRVLQDIMETQSQLLPRGELKAYAGYVKERNQSRDSGVAHMDVDEKELRT